MQKKYSADWLEKAEIVKRKIKDLQLDPENVRFSHIPQIHKSTKNIEEIMKEDDGIFDLYDQILSSNGIIEPIVIDSNNMVIEGNRRLTCLRLLDDQAKKGELDDEGISRTQFEEVQCRLLPKIDDETRDLFLATIHVKGKKPWKRFNKAKHIYRLNRMHKISYDEIARLLGMGKATVQRNVSVYVEVSKYHTRFSDDKEWFKKFMLYEQFFMRKDLRDFREDQENINIFAKWVYSGKFQNHKDIRRLYEVLNDEDSKNEFEKTNMENAIKTLETKNPELVDADFKKINDTISVLQEISRAKLNDIVSNPEKIKLLNSLEHELKNLLIDIESRKDSLRKK
ncbi:MAG: hypothetical protein ABIJ92_04450 [Candidatus Aenigmatarchaeota archaeon]